MTYQYDERGNEIEYYRCDEDGESWKITYQYDERGNLLEQIEY